jgi:hypothetical protein
MKNFLQIVSSRTQVEERVQDDFILEDPDFLLECAYTMADELEWPADLVDPSVAMPTSTNPILTQDINERYTNVVKEKAHLDRGTVPEGPTARDIDDCLRNEYVLPGCRMSVDEYILQLNGIKLLSRCSWRTLELVILPLVKMGHPLSLVLLFYLLCYS